MTITIRSPANNEEWEAYYDLRYRVLRKPLDRPRGSERNEDDAKNRHFALFKDAKLTAIARLDQPSENTAQVRFVAVETSSQRKGHGTKLMQFMEEQAKARGDTEMMLHARDYAIRFYQKQDYELVGKSYLLFGKLQHFLMKKALPH